MKKTLSLIIAMLLMINVLAGCGTDEGTQVNGEAESTKSVTLSFGSHQSGLPTSGIVQELAKEFEAETGIKIDFQISPDAQWRDLIKVKMDSGEAPDIICVDTPISLISSLRMDDYATPLTDQEWVARMDENVLPAVSVDGETYGITFPGKKMWFFIYNKEIFENLGLEIPTTYEELKAVSQAILDAGTIPMYEPTTNGWHQVLPLFETGGLYQQNHADLYNKLNNNEMDLDEVPELLTIITQLKECADAGYFGEDYLSNNWENAKEAIASGKYAMTVAEAGFKNEVEADFPEFGADKLGIFVMPWGDNQVIGVNPASNAYFINKESKYIEEAKQFFDFLAKPENLARRLEGQPGLKELSWPEVPSRFTEEEETYIDSMDKASVVQVAVNYIDAQWMDVGSDLEGMFAGAMTPEDVLASMMERRSDMAELQKDPGWVK